MIAPLFGASVLAGARVWAAAASLCPCSSGPPPVLDGLGALIWAAGLIRRSAWWRVGQPARASLRALFAAAGCCRLAGVDAAPSGGRGPRGQPTWPTFGATPGISEGLPLGFRHAGRSASAPAIPPTLGAPPSAFCATLKLVSRASSRACSAAPSAPACSRWRSPASSPRRWTRTRPPRSSASTSPTSTRSGSAPDDYERFKDYETSLAQELSGHLLEHARRHDYDLLTRPVVNLDQDDRLRLGEFGIQTRLVKPPQRQGAEPDAGRARAHDGLLGDPGREGEVQAPPGAAYVETRAIVSLDDRRYVLDGPTAALGRSKECDCVVDDPNVSRRHAELRRSSVGDWQIVDLGSTNGVKVNGRRVANARLSPGDEITLGTTVFTFDIEQ